MIKPANSFATKYDIARLEAKLSLLQWVVGGIGVGVLLLVIKAFLPV